MMIMIMIVIYVRRAVSGTHCLVTSLGVWGYNIIYFIKIILYFIYLYYILYIYIDKSI